MQAVWLQAVRLHLKCFIFRVFVHLFSCRLTSQRELVFTLSVKMEQRGWETALLEFKGSLLGICTVKEELAEYG